MKKILTNYTLENQLRASSLFENHFILVPLRLAVIKKLVATLKNKFAPMIATLRTCLCSANPLYFSCDSLVIKDGSILMGERSNIKLNPISGLFFRISSILPTTKFACSLLSCSAKYWVNVTLIKLPPSFLRITVFSISSKDIINFYYRYY